MNGSYYAVIPAKVLHDKDLLKYPKSILLYGHIANLANQKGYCWATNKYFMEQLGVKSATTITDYLNLLVRKGFIKKKKIYKDGTKQIEKRIISIDTGTPMPPDCNTSTPADCNSPIPPDCKENNTSINNTSINNNKRDIREKSGDFSAGTSSDNIPYSEIVEYLNKRTGKKYRASSQKTKRLIKARFNEKYTVDDFKKVIDNKCLEWLRDDKMSRYLRPETLFGTKFESYLNQDSKNNQVPNGWANYYKDNGGTEAW